MSNFNLVKHLYHFTDTRNLSLIKQHGGLYSLAQLQNRGIEVPAYGGDEGSQATDASTGMDQFVHLCFDYTHPMEYQAKKAGRILESVFLKIDKSVLYLPGVLFTAGMANQNGITLLTREQAEQEFDLECLLVEGLKWNEEPIKGRRKIAKKYEILVPDFVPVIL